MIKVGLIGFGNWGKILHKKLIMFCDVKFVCRSKDEYHDKLKDVDWVVVATPNNTHYKIVKDCLNAKKNVFCEKPLTPTEEQSKQLFSYADFMGVKLYVNDIQNYRDVNWDLLKNNLIERKKKDKFNRDYYETKDLLYRLAYHDIYYLYQHIKDSKIKSVEPIDLDEKIRYKVKFNDVSVEFNYDTNYEHGRVHHINGVNLMGDDDALLLMLKKVFSNEVDFQYNKKISLFTNKFIDTLNKKLFKKIAVIGGGIFGCTTAWILAKEGYNVDLFEKNNDILTQASYINQYRLHRGYHYPRSKETAQSSIEGERSFLKVYGDSVMNGKTKHYYCIAKDDSLVTSKQYIDFLNDLNLPNKKKKLDIMNENVVDLIIEANEMLFNPDKLKKICWNQLNKHNVIVNLNTEFKKEKYDYVINATYANINGLVPNNKQKEYQFELCEKPVIKLPKKYKHKSVVIMDGPFMCIDPLGDTDYHVMGNVVHAIHTTNVGKFPKCDGKYNNLLNKGIVKNPSITNIKKFIKSAQKFFKDIDKAKHIGSMFTYRTVLPNKDKDDARPTLVERIDGRKFNLFSGKIGTCVNAAYEVLGELDG